MTQTFCVFGLPRGQGRPKATRRGNHAGVYEDAKDKQYKSNIAAQVVQQRPVYIEAAPIVLTCLFMMPRPKYHFDAKGGLKDRFRWAVPVGKPDLSNLIKAVEDALNGIVWADDSLIVGYGNPGKFYTISQPRIDIIVRAGDTAKDYIEADIEGYQETLP